MAEGCYVDLYLPASYKGVPFECMETSSEHGRRGAEGEFPFGENTGYADLGRRIRTYSVRGRFPTNAHILAATALIAAVESPGPGLLIHPTRGPVQVACRSLHVTDNPLEEQGVTYVDMDFVEANDWLNGFSFGNLLTAGLSLVALIAASRAVFVRDYKPKELSYTQVAGVHSSAASGILNIKEELNSAIFADTTQADINAWKALLDLERAAADPVTLNDSSKVFETVRLGLAAVSTFREGDDKYQAFRRIANFNAKVATLGGDAGTAQNAVYQMIRIIAAGYMARATLETDISTTSEGFTVFDQVTAIFEEEIQVARATCDDLLFLELRKFLTTAQTVILNRVYNLPALVIYDFGGSVHSLVASYEIYNDAKRFAEIEAQNPSQYPWQVGPEVVASRA